MPMKILRSEKMKALLAKGKRRATAKRRPEMVASRVCTMRLYQMAGIIRSIGSTIRGLSQSRGLRFLPFTRAIKAALRIAYAATIEGIRPHRELYA